MGMDGRIPKYNHCGHLDINGYCIHGFLYADNNPWGAFYNKLCIVYLNKNNYLRSSQKSIQAIPDLTGHEITLPLRLKDDLRTD